jgi:hypothetical protein
MRLTEEWLFGIGLGATQPWSSPLLMRFFALLQNGISLFMAIRFRHHDGFDLRRRNRTIRVFFSGSISRRACVCFGPLRISRSLARTSRSALVGSRIRLGHTLVAVLAQLGDRVERAQQRSAPMVLVAVQPLAFDGVVEGGQLG